MMKYENECLVNKSIVISIYAKVLWCFLLILLDWYHKNNSQKYFVKLFNGDNHAALNHHISTRYEILSALHLSKYSRFAPAFSVQLLTHNTSFCNRSTNSFLSQVQYFESETLKKWIAKNFKNSCMNFWESPYFKCTDKVEVFSSTIQKTPG